MAGTSLNRKVEHSSLSAVEELRLQFNRLLDDVELLRTAIVAIATKLDSDAGVTATNFVSVDCAPINPATDLLAAKVLNHSGA